MDVMEKLVELIKKASYECDEGARDLRDMKEAADSIDDFLITNGVTVQEWISVDEPPKEYRDEYGELIPFLVCEEGTDYPFRAMYDGKTWGDGIFALPVKWRMNLPAPPKEKERQDGDGNV